MAIGPAFQVHRDDADIDRIRHGATVIPAPMAIFRVEGPGALTCLQGLLTNDLDQPGVHSLVYGALLTPKGMIVLDLWVLRDSAGFTLVVPMGARETALKLFKRSLPPRLARLTDRTGEWTTAWLLGSGVAVKLPLAGLGELAAPGAVSAMPVEGAPLQLAAGTETAWFQAMLVGPIGAIAAATARLAEAGVHAGNPEDATAARVLAGWPTLGAEIGDKTLPQEVAFDEIGGVSYTKGCYTGQETVARVHFRGHPNRELRGLLWKGVEELHSEVVEAADKEVGRFTSLVVTPTRRSASRYCGGKSSPAWPSPPEANPPPWFLSHSARTRAPPDTRTPGQDRPGRPGVRARQVREPSRCPGPSWYQLRPGQRCRRQREPPSPAPRQRVQLLPFGAQAASAITARADRTFDMHAPVGGGAVAASGTMFDPETAYSRRQYRGGGAHVNIFK